MKLPNTSTIIVYQVWVSESKKSFLYPTTTIHQRYKENVDRKKKQIQNHISCLLSSFISILFSFISFFLFYTISFFDSSHSFHLNLNTFLLSIFLNSNIYILPLPHLKSLMHSKSESKLFISS